MRKIYKLKEWYSLEQASERLSLICGDTVTPNDILHMVVDGYLPLSCYLTHQVAERVAPFTKNMTEIFNRMEMALAALGNKPFEKNNTTRYALTYETQEIRHLDGIYTFDFTYTESIKHDILSYLLEESVETVSMDGYFVTDSEQNLWRLLERNEDIKSYDKKTGEALPYLDPSLYFPAGDYPSYGNWVIQASHLSQLEERLNQEQVKAVKEEKPNQRKMNNLLRVINGLARAIYAYNPHAPKSDTIKEMIGDLSNADIKIDDETLRGYLREGNELLEVKNLTKPN